MIKEHNEQIWEVINYHARNEQLLCGYFPGLSVGSIFIASDLKTH